MSPSFKYQWVEAVLPAAPIATSRARLHARRDTRNSYVSVWRTDIDAVAPLSNRWLIRLSEAFLSFVVISCWQDFLLTGGNYRLAGCAFQAGISIKKSKFHIGVRGSSHQVVQNLNQNA